MTTGRRSANSTLNIHFFLNGLVFLVVTVFPANWLGHVLGQRAGFAH